MSTLSPFLIFSHSSTPVILHSSLTLLKKATGAAKGEAECKKDPGQDDPDDIQSLSKAGEDDKAQAPPEHEISKDVHNDVGHNIERCERQRVRLIDVLDEAAVEVVDSVEEADGMGKSLNDNRHDDLQKGDCLMNQGLWIYGSRWLRSGDNVDLMWPNRVCGVGECVSVNLSDGFGRDEDEIVGCQVFMLVKRIWIRHMRCLLSLLCVRLPRLTGRKTAGGWYNTKVKAVKFDLWFHISAVAACRTHRVFQKILRLDQIDQDSVTCL